MDTEGKESGWSGFRKIFFHESLPPQDVQDVLAASNLLEISEFEIFRLSYAYWYGNLPAEADVESAFTPYMFEGKVPVFVRQFSRRVKVMDSDGEVDPLELGVMEKAPVFRELRLGVLIFVLLFAVQLLIYTMAAYTAGNMPLLIGRCFLPPCY